MSRNLYLECASGISGDMFVAAMLDLGADEEKLKQVLASIPVQGAEILVSRVKKSGLDVCDFLVKLDAEHENHDHDMEYLHGHEHNHSHDHDHDHKHDHDHDHKHDHDHDHEHSHAHEHVHDHEHNHSHEHAEVQGHHHSHEHRGLPEILSLLRSGKLSERALGYAERIFTILAEAEAKAHGVPMDQVHFHEVGAVDSILDIAAAAICLDDLDVEKIYIPELTEGSGTIRCQHGILPIPVPAVSNIAAAHGLPIHRTGIRGELITPTGAAIAAAIRTEEPLPEHYVIEGIGMGGGKREYETPGFLRAMLIRENASPARTVDTDRICRLETNVDDCTGEELGYVLNHLMEAGARDVHYTPVYMKKNRPAYEITVICDPRDTEIMENIIFRETTTIGIRRILMDRTVLKRSFDTADTPWGPVGLKLCQVPGEEKPRCYIEYRDLENAAKKAGISMREIRLYIEKNCM